MTKKLYYKYTQAPMFLLNITLHDLTQELLYSIVLCSLQHLVLDTIFSVKVMKSDTVQYPVSIQYYCIFYIYIYQHHTLRWFGNVEILQD